MQSTISMGKAPAVRASRALQSVNVRKMYARAISLARSKSLTIAVISAGISLKPAGTAINFRELFSLIGSFIKSHSIVLAVISAAVSYTGILFDSGIVNALGAFVALSFVCIADTTQKGGER